MDIEARRRSADENILAAFRLTSERLGDPRAGIARFGPVDVVAVGVDVAFFNPVLALDPAARADDIVAGIAWVEARGLPVSVQVRDDLDPGVRARLEATGMVADPSATPVMVLDPIATAPRPRQTADVLVRTGGVELIDDWHAALEAGDVQRRILGHAMIADPAVRVAVGYVDDQPVSAAAAIRSGETLGVYAVGTIERARRRGLGRAVTWAVIDAGVIAWGSTIAILQSSEMGIPLYRSMGFEEVSRYIEYGRPTS